MMHRRTLLRGLIGVIAAPAIVRATSIMPVKAWDVTTLMADCGRFVTGTEIAMRQAAAIEGWKQEWQKQLFRALNDAKFMQGLQWPDEAAERHRLALERAIA